MKMRRTTPPTGLPLLAGLVSGACLAADNARESSPRAAELARFAANVAADGAALEKRSGRQPRAHPARCAVPVVSPMPAFP